MPTPSEANGPTNVGDLLLKTGVISSEQLQAAVEYQKRSGEDLAHALFALGFISDKVIAKLAALRDAGLGGVALRLYAGPAASIRLIGERIIPALNASSVP